VFFWYGIFTLGRWAGSFADRGWVCISPQIRVFLLTAKGLEYKTQNFCEQLLCGICGKLPYILLWIYEYIPGTPECMG
jgi:hypothetical protein